jgi:RNA polymerase sigma-70 factor (ECF subfamily)
MIALVPRLRRFCAALTRSIDEGDDLAQATVERALSRIGHWQEDTSLDSWMFTIARNLHIDQYRAGRRRGVAVGVEALEFVTGEDGRRTTEVRSELARARQAIMALSDDQRMLITLVIMDGQSYKDAARILEIPIGTVMSRIARARRSIDAYMTASAGEYAV